MHLAGCRPARRAFQTALGNPETVQRARLGAVLRSIGAAPAWPQLDPTIGYERFRQAVRPSTYADLEPELERQRREGVPRLGPSGGRWQPTSGSTSHRKWIPYPAPFLAELNAAAGAWMADLAQMAPAAFQGRHYWSLSWLPTEQREKGGDPDDLNLLPAWKRLALGSAMAVPAAVANLETSGESLLATAAWLAARRDLALMSVWSPTFGLSLLQTLADHRDALAEGLRTGRWPWGPGPREPGAGDRLKAWNGSLDPAFFAELWPRLAVVSAWEEGASAHHARRLRGLLPHARFQGKGLWATEGVVTIPFRDRHPLALTGHFLEFRCLATGRIVPSWELEPDQEVQPLLSTSAGLLRYGLDDRLKVTAFLDRTPCLTFLGRIGGTDMVGEKLDETAVARVLDGLERSSGVRCLTLFAVQGEPCGYALLGEGGEEGLLRGAELEAELGRFHHYRLARELNQLAPAEVWVVPDARPILARLAAVRGQGEGEAKSARLEAWPVSLERLPVEARVSE